MVIKVMQDLYHQPYDETTIDLPINIPEHSLILHPGVEI